jgi:hypothetical protein
MINVCFTTACVSLETESVYSETGPVLLEIGLVCSKTGFAHLETAILIFRSSRI